VSEVSLTILLVTAQSRRRRTISLRSRKVSRGLRFLGGHCTYFGLMVVENRGPDVRRNRSGARGALRVHG
jgi:hypothetical protein